MKKIIVPLDGSELSERAVRLAEMFARKYDALIELIHVLEEPIAFDLMPSLVIPDRADAERYLKRIADRLPEDVTVARYVLRGEPVAELLEMTQFDEDSMIVMATQGRGGLGRMMFGSVADKVLRGSSVPVALVRGLIEPRHSEFTSLLVPLDRSEYAEEALDVAMDLAKRSGASLTLLFVCEPFADVPYVAVASELMYLSSAQMAELEESCIEDARHYLEPFAEKGRAHGIRVDWEIRSGKPADEIIRAADTTGVDLIVMSTHGRGGIRRLALGSVTNEVLHRGSAPILALPPRSISQSPEDSRKREPVANGQLLPSS